MAVVYVSCGSWCKKLFRLLSAACAVLLGTRSLRLSEAHSPHLGLWEKSLEQEMTNIVNSDYMEYCILTLLLFVFFLFFLFSFLCSSLFCSDLLTSFPSFSLLVSFAQDFSNDDTRLEYNVDADNGIAMEGYLFKRASNAFKTWNRSDRHRSISIFMNTLKIQFYDKE